MKPIPEVIFIRRVRRATYDVRHGSSQSCRTDYHYQPMGEEQDRNGRKMSRPPSFREISREFLKSETHQHFLAELLLFAAISAISAWPLFSLADAMANLPK